MLKPLYSFVFFFVVSLNYFAQTSVGIQTVTIQGEKDIDDQKIEDKAFQILNERDDEKRLELNAELKSILSNELSKSSAFTFPFDKVKSLSILTPTDSTFRLFNWTVPLSDGSHSYECGLLRKSSENETEFYFLNDTIIKDREKLEKFNASADQWIGALYYKIIENKSKFQTYYTLLAWDGNDLMTNKKIIEVLWFTKRGKAKFGAPIFKSNRRPKSRIVFEFGGQNSMRLTYEPKLNRILFDHLAPPNKTLNGIYEYYGADLSFDAYDWKNGAWVYVPDVDADESLVKKKRDFKVSEEEIKNKRTIYSTPK